MITYEWVIETIDEYGDIQDVTHADSLEEATKTATVIRAEGKTVDVGLTRSRWNNYDKNLEDRQWAYLNENGKLPQLFDGGSHIPKEFKKCQN